MCHFRKTLLLKKIKWYKFYALNNTGYVNSVIWKVSTIWAMQHYYIKYYINAKHQPVLLHAAHLAKLLLQIKSWEWKFMRYETQVH